MAELLDALRLVATVALAWCGAAVLLAALLAAVFHARERWDERRRALERRRLWLEAMR